MSDHDRLIVDLVTSCYEGDWLPHWNSCTSTFYSWIKNPTENKQLFIKDIIMDLKRINLMLECIFEKDESEARKFVGSVDSLNTQRERLKFILSLVSDGQVSVEDTIVYNFPCRQLHRKKLVMAEQIHETDSLLEKYKQKSIRRVFLKEKVA
jgi:hypothetical protein